MMRPSRHTLRRVGRLLVLLVAAGASLNSAVARQDETGSRVILDAESVEETLVNGVTTTLLIHATLTQDETTVIADRLVKEGEETEHYLLTGNVRIFERGDTVDADVVHYDGNSKVGQASGNVTMTDGASTLTAISAIYYSEEKRTEFNEGVAYTDSLTVLTSERGTYWSDDTVADFNGNVRLRQEDLYLEADSIHYQRDSDVMQAWGSVVIDRFEGEVDSTRIGRQYWFGYDGSLQGFVDEFDRSLLFSETVYYDGEIDSSWVDGGVFLLRTQRQEAEVDSLMIQARSMILTQNDANDRVIAMDSVVVLDPDFAVIGDSLVYDRRTENDIESMNSHIFGRPRAWVSDSQITSDSLRIYGTDGSIDSLLAVSNLFVANLDTTLDRIQQIQGRSMTAYFREDSLRTMIVSPNAEVLFYFEPEAGEPVSAIQSSGDRFTFVFRNGEVDQLLGLSGLEGSIYRNNIIDQAKNLAGFVWEPERKPLQRIMHSELQVREQGRIKRHESKASVIKPENEFR